KWRNVIVHASARAGGPLARGCHFVIGQHPGADGCYVTATQRWKQQDDGQHASMQGYDYNRNSIGICLMGDFSSRPPGRDQFDAAVALVRQLRRQFAMPSDRVYLAHQLPLGDKSPGNAFPAGLFEYLVKAPLR
ncbi:MAG TPA: peptidoglycan recognition family protein, partial [Phycisphaerae bacterium]|nr:peptidoglycan recognition family protein [Phycisphaerae bacterium]